MWLSCRECLVVSVSGSVLSLWPCSDRSGISPVVVQLELDIRQWQEEQHCARLPTADEDSVLHRRIANYCNKEKSARCRLMRAAYPADVENIQELKLDCLEASDDGDGCVKWRSDVERQMMQSIPGRPEGDVVMFRATGRSTVFWCTVDVDMDGETAMVAERPHTQTAKEVFALLANVNLKFETKLRRAAQMLACTPTFTGVGGALSRLVFYSQEEDNVEKPLQRFQCRLRDVGATGERAFLDHVMEKHSGGAD